MADIFDVEITVISQKGTCGAGHKAGDKWIVSNHVPAGICLSAYPSLQSSIDVLKYGGSFPWSKDPDENGAVCPDPQNPVTFKIRRIKKKK
jgi:uncharacterized repeat protein (TIGR04076 family)